MPTVLGENDARMAFASKTARTTRTACKDQSVWTAVVNLAVTNKKIVDLAKFAPQREAVCVMLDLSTHPMDAKTSMSVKMRFAIHLPGAPTHLAPSNANVHLVLLAIHMSMAAQVQMSVRPIETVAPSWPVRETRTATGSASTRATRLSVDPMPTVKLLITSLSVGARRNMWAIQAPL